MLDKQKHVEYIKRTMATKNMLYYLADPIRLSTVYWATNSLKLLQDDHLGELRPSVVSLVKSCLNEDGGFGGRAGYPSTVMSTFTALQVLYLHDTVYFSQDTVDYILHMQDSDGGFANDEYGEKDTRLDCCAVLSLHLLSIMREECTADGGTEEQEPRHFAASKAGFDRSRLGAPIPEQFLEEIKFDRGGAVGHILSCYNADGGFGQLARTESHAAQIFCCLSALRSLGCIGAVDASRIEDFLAYRQCPSGGLNGRINKKEDVCYSFWAFAAARLLGSECIDARALRAFIYSCEGEDGGFSDRKGNECDLYHLMFSLASLSMLGEDGLDAVDPGFAL